MITESFSVICWDQGKFSVKNSRGEWWTGDENEWVHENGSYWAMAPDCYNYVFTWEELCKFLKNNFNFSFCEVKNPMGGYF